jgi:uncharacterized protein (TIGR02145 family)
LVLEHLNKKMKKITMNCRIMALTALALTLLFGCSGVKSAKESAKKIETVTIGSQVWMKKNLDVDHYRNGDPIPQVTDPAQWENLKTGAWSYYNNDPAMGATYGKFYNWYAVNDPRGLAPAGWHVASDAEWETLALYIGGKETAGDKLRETGTTHWQNPNSGATDKVGFSGLPGGWRNSYGGYFDSIGSNGTWWTSTNDNDSYAWGWYLLYNYKYVGRSHYVKPFGFSVRCVKD